MPDEHPSLVTPKAKEKKEPPAVTEIRYVKVDELEELFGKLKEQLLVVDLAPVMERLERIEKLFNTTIVLLKEKVDVDVLEAEDLELLQKKMQK